MPIPPHRPPSPTPRLVNSQRPRQVIQPVRQPPSNRPSAPPSKTGGPRSVALPPKRTAKAGVSPRKRGGPRTVALPTEGTAKPGASPSKTGGPRTTAPSIKGPGAINAVGPRRLPPPPSHEQALAHERSRQHTVDFTPPPQVINPGEWQQALPPFLAGPPASDDKVTPPSLAIPKSRQVPPHRPTMPSTRSRGGPGQV